MGYRKYSPFLKSVKVLILLSFMYFTTRLDALRFPITTKNFDYQKLPIYCQPSTGHFECKHENGTVYCLPNSMKCRIRCLNDAELKCPYTATSCPIGTFRCASNSSSNRDPVCLPETSLCDGRTHCPLSDDENPSLCNTRTCEAKHFSCKSPGHCISHEKVCDGKFDCRRPGYNDITDEYNCAKERADGQCPRQSVLCKDNTCVKGGIRCDGYKDCDDNSDEEDCEILCGPKELKCDDKCVTEEQICDHTAHCSDGKDELNCPAKPSRCTFSGDFQCKFIFKCISSIFLCDGKPDCPDGSDEICRHDHRACELDKHWRCKHGSHCVLNSTKCDGWQHCPDGSDELNCPTPPPPTEPPCPSNAHHCISNSSSSSSNAHCIDLRRACAGQISCPTHDATLKPKCDQLISATSPCRINNGNCEHICNTDAEASSDGKSVKFVGKCSCKHGWQVSHNNASQCVDSNECEVFGTCSQLCINTVGSYRCSCRPGYLQNGKNCVAPGTSKLIIATSNSIDVIDRDTNVRLSIASGILAKQVAYDFNRKLVYFHTRDGIVGEVGLDGKNKRILTTGVSFSGMTYDWMRRLLFYTVQGTPERGGYVGVMNVSNGANVTLKRLDCPHGLVANPQLGKLYVTQWCGEQPGVYTMPMGGTAIEMMVQAEGLPAHLTLDLAARPQRLYWVDISVKSVHSSTIIGTDKRTHFRMSDKTDIFSNLVAFEQQLYWNEHAAGNLYRAEKDYGANLTKIYSAANIPSFAIYHSLLQPSVQLGSCEKCEELCIAGSSLGSRPTCLCNSLQSLTYDRKCIDRTDIEISSNETIPVNSLSQQQFHEDDTKPRVAIIGGVILLSVTVVCIIGVCLVVMCLRSQDKHSISFGSLNSQIDKEEQDSALRMPKVDSRTPLTMCEIEQDNTRF